jgi:hypothetical protein
MRKLYETNPGDSTYATGYAFALAQAGKGAEALAVVEKIPPDERNYPPRQPYVAFVYGVNRKTSEIEHSQTLVEGVNLLPEESYLFTRAREEANRRPEKSKAAKPAGESASPAAKS